MPHDEHFLQRIDRLTAPLAELALGLYRDHEFVRFLLAKIAHGSNADRIALALTDAPDGPHVVVARDGAFVTCLGAGMSTAPHPVVPRARIDGLLQLNADLRHRHEMALRFGGTERAFDTLVPRIYAAGDALSREEFEALCAIQPILEGSFQLEALRLQNDFPDYIKNLGILVDAHGAARHHDRLLSLWRAGWALGHLSVLGSLRGADSFERWRGVDVMKIAFVSQAASCTGTLGVVVRSAWSLGRTKMFVPMLKKVIATGDRRSLMEGTVGLLAIAARSTKARVEAVKAIEPPLPVPPPGTREHQLFRGRAAMAELVRRMLADRPGFVSHATRTMQALWIGAQRGETGTPYHYADASDVPADLALAHGMNSSVVVMDHDGPARMLGLTLWAARESAEKFYLPRAVLKTVREPWSLAKGEHALRSARTQAYPVPEHPAVRAVATPGRNEACSCGSGKKYKRCCGA